jgi:hypothetical protein
VGAKRRLRPNKDAALESAITPCSKDEVGKSTIDRDGQLDVLGEGCANDIN